MLCKFVICVCVYVQCLFISLACISQIFRPYTFLLSKIVKFFTVNSILIIYFYVEYILSWVVFFSLLACTCVYMFACYTMDFEWVYIKFLFWWLNIYHLPHIYTSIYLDCVQLVANFMQLMKKILTSVNKFKCWPYSRRATHTCSTHTKITRHIELNITIFTKVTKQHFLWNIHT